MTLSKLRLLDLSNNNLKHLVFRLPDSIEFLSINNNNLITWPLLSTPKNLTELMLNHNSLERIFPKDQEVQNLRILDVSNNIIHYMPNTQFMQLEKLDLSYNLLNVIPVKLNSIAPLLRNLIVDGTQIEVIKFEEKTILESISLSNLPLLKEIQARAFENLSGSKVTRDESENCIDLKISHNEFLTKIDEAAFEGLAICSLDLSYNNLTEIPENLTDWTKLDNGIDIQGNPLDCSCHNQWMLDSILNTLYYKDFLQVLLLELRCQSPGVFKGKRLVSFLNHKDPFCSDGEDYGEKTSKIIQQSNFGGFFLDSEQLAAASPTETRIRFSLAPFSIGFILILVLCFIILILIIIVGVKWQNDQQKKYRRNRLYYDDFYY